MNITLTEESLVKRLSLKHQMEFSNMLRGFVIDDLLWRIYSGDYKEYLWLANFEDVGCQAYARGQEKSLRFVYKKSEKKIFEEGPIAGKDLSEELLQNLVEKNFYNSNASGIEWMAQVGRIDNGYEIALIALCEQLKVPVRILIHELEDVDSLPGKNIVEALTNRHPITIYTYSAENSLCKSLYEILYKLELIGSMEAYDRVDSIIKNQSISGRHVMEQLLELQPREKKFYVAKRMDQIQSYRNYTYMRKRWEQYQKKTDHKTSTWEELIDRLLKFAGPIWTALCEESVFFDDWMPELERFLG